MSAKDENDPLVQAALKAGWKTALDKKKNKHYYTHKALKATTWDLKKDLLAGKYPMPEGAEAGGGTPAAGGKTPTPGGKTPAPGPGGNSGTPGPEDDSTNNANPAVASLPAVDGTVYYRELHGVTRVAYQDPSAAPSAEGQRKGMIEMNNALHTQLERVRQEKALLQQAIAEADVRNAELKNSLAGIASENISGEEEQIILIRHERDENRQRQSQLTKLIDIVARGLHEPGAPAYEASVGQRNGTDVEGASMVTRFLDSSARHALSPQSILNVTRYRDALLQGQQSNTGSASAGQPFTWYEAASSGLQPRQDNQTAQVYDQNQHNQQRQHDGSNSLGLAKFGDIVPGAPQKEAASTPGAGGLQYDGFIVRS